MHRQFDENPCDTDFIPWDIGKEDQDRILESLVMRSADAVAVLVWPCPNPIYSPMVYANAEFTRFTGYTRNDFDQPGCSFIPHLFPSLSDKRAVTQEILAGRTHRTMAQFLSKSGVQVTGEVTIIPPVAGSGKTVGDGSVSGRYIVVTLRDFEQGQPSTMQEQTAASDLRRIVEGAHCLLWHVQVEQRDGFLTWDHYGTAGESNATRWMPIHIEPGQTFFTAFQLSIHPSDRSRIDANASHALESGATGYMQEFRCRLDDGSVMWVAEDVHIEKLGGGMWHVVGVVKDISEQKRTAEVLAEERNLLRRVQADREILLQEATDRADRDPLTRLWNHRAFQKRLRDEADYSDAIGTSFAVIVLDMDNFKFFNDSYGHAVGDEVLCKVADALTSLCREDDAVARFGGDEFAILMPHIDIRTAAQRGREISDALQSLGYSPPGHPVEIPIRLSFGLAVYPDEVKTRHEAIALADERLYQAKSGSGAATEMANRVSAELCAHVKGFAVLKALVEAIDKKDRYTRRHSQEVMMHTASIAEAMGLDAGARRTLEIAALLLDVGMIGVPDGILRKPASLTEEEFTAVALHPTMGAIIIGASPEFVASAPGFTDIVAAVKHHHEKWDGYGYPDGLAGTIIPVYARILAVADAFTAMITDRPYRKALSPEDAINELRQFSGAFWDPQIVDTFIAANTPARRG